MKDNILRAGFCSSTSINFVYLACLEGINVEDYADAPWLNGREHPKDASTEH